MNVLWKKMSDRVIRVNRWRSLRQKRYCLPSGVVSDFYTINRHDVVCSMVVTKNGRVVLAKQFRPGTERVMNELPGGGINRGETPRHAAVREVLEETGYRGHVQFVGKSSNDGWVDGWRYHFLITQAVLAHSPKPDKNEPIEVITVTMKKFVTMVAQGKMTDSETAYRGLIGLGILKEKK